MSNKRTNAYFAGACAAVLEHHRIGSPYRVVAFRSAPIGESFLKWSGRVLRRIARSLGIPARVLRDAESSYSTLRAARSLR